MKLETTIASFGIGTVLAVWGAAIVGIIGWGMNINALIQCDFEPKYRAEVIRAVGVVVPPVGAIAGWVTIEDEKE